MNNKEKEITDIGKMIAEYYNIEFYQLCSKTKKREIVTARQMAHAVCREKTKSSLENIGRVLGYKDHATVLHGTYVINNLCDSDKSIKDDFEYLKLKAGFYVRNHDILKLRVKINKAKQL